MESCLIRAISDNCEDKFLGTKTRYIFRYGFENIFVRNDSIYADMYVEGWKNNDLYTLFFTPSYECEWKVKVDAFRIAISDENTLILLEEYKRALCEKAMQQTRVLPEAFLGALFSSIEHKIFDLEQQILSNYKDSKEVLQQNHNKSNVL